MKTTIAILVLTYLQFVSPILSKSQAEDVLGGEVRLEANTTKWEKENTVTETRYCAVKGDPRSGGKVKLYLVIYSFTFLLIKP